jgi:hypothetical protein
MLKLKREQQLLPSLLLLIGLLLWQQLLQQFRQIGWQ